MNCYFYMINLKGMNCKNKHHVHYPNVPSAIRPTSHYPDLVPEPDDNMEYSSDSEHSDMTVIAVDDTYKPEEDNQPVSLTQVELNDLAWNLNLSRESAQLLGSYLNEKHLLAPGTTFSWYQNRKLSFSCFRIIHYWFIATTLLDWSNNWA